MKNYQRPVLIGASALILVASVVFFPRRSTNSSSNVAEALSVTEQAVTAEVIDLKRQPLTDAVEGLIGTVKGNTIELTFNGQEERLTDVHVQVGKHVHAGQVLFELDHTRAEARKSQAQMSFERAKELLEAGGATKRDVAEARAALNLARKDYEDTFIYSPQSGIICQVNRQQGETVGRSEVVGVLVSDHDSFYVETGVIEGLLDQIVAGQDAVVQIEAFGNKEIAGTVRGVSREVTTTGRTGTVLISLPKSVQDKLRPGLSARCSIYVFNVSKALVIPRSAYDAKNNCVFVVDKKNRAHKTVVKLGHITRDAYQVLRGLHEGDRLIKDIVATPVEDAVLVKPVLEQSADMTPSAGPAGASS
ncbi:MAG: efflux RND transporter periplasmic adaptor subunit [Elusimicrobiota bacterium]|jgi:RND family efflux transporter MFP subunit